MAIRSLIFHRIVRWQEEQPSELRLGKPLNEVTADHESLFGQFKKLFHFRAGKLFGRFDGNYSESPFQSLLQEQQTEKIGFEQLTLKFASEFKEQLDKTTEQYESYLTFVQEDRADGPRLYIFMMTTRSGFAIDNSLQLDTVDYLNTSSLDLALRIDLDTWADQEDKETPYLTLVRGRSNAKVGEAFTKVSGFHPVIDSQKETEDLMALLTAYTQKSDPKDANNVRQKAYEFCVEQEHLGEPVPLNELSGYLDENQPTRFAEYAEEQGEMPTQKQLRPDSRKLKHLVRLSGKGNGLSLSFSSDLIQQTVLFDEKTDTLTITSIPKSLKKQIVSHLRENEEQ